MIKANAYLGSWGLEALFIPKFEPWQMAEPGSPWEFYRPDSMLVWLSPSPLWYYGVFALLGIAMGAMVVSGILVIMEFCEPERRPTYAGLTNSSMGLIGIAAPLVGAWLAQISYSWLFALSAFASLLAYAAMHWWVKEPRWA